MRAAIVDVGSNSIKLLVADRGQTGVIEEVLSRTLEVRIGSGIGSESPSLGEEAIARGVAAVTELVTEARLLGADRLSGVATSAVRDASNGAQFIERVKCAAGLDLRVLSGLEEADGIGRGLTTDPALAGLSDFHVYDLGGGSLECLSFRSRRVERAVSLPLGCVRLTEMLVADPTDPLPDADAERIRAHVKEVVTASGFPLPVPPGSGVVGTGGTLTTVRSIQAARTGTGFARSDPLIPVSMSAGCPPQGRLPSRGSALQDSGASGLARRRVPDGARDALGARRPGGYPGVPAFASEPALGPGRGTSRLTGT